MVLYYREDYFTRYGIKTSALGTWDDFIRKQFLSGLTTGAFKGV